MAIKQASDGSWRIKESQRDELLNLLFKHLSETGSFKGFGKIFVEGVARKPKPRGSLSKIKATTDIKLNLKEKLDTSEAKRTATTVRSLTAQQAIIEAFQSVQNISKEEATKQAAEFVQFQKQRLKEFKSTVKQISRQTGIEYQGGHNISAKYGGLTTAAQMTAEPKAINISKQASADPNVEALRAIDSPKTWREAVINYLDPSGLSNAELHSPKGVASQFDLTQQERLQVLQAPTEEEASRIREQIDVGKTTNKGGAINFTPDRAKLTALAGAGIAALGPLGTAASAAETTGRVQLATQTKGLLDYAQAGISAVSAAADVASYVPVVAPVGEAVSTTADVINVGIDVARSKQGKQAIKKVLKDPMNELEYWSKKGLKLIGGAVRFW